MRTFLTDTHTFHEAGSDREAGTAGFANRTFGHTQEWAEHCGVCRAGGDLTARLRMVRDRVQECQAIVDELFPADQPKPKADPPPRSYAQWRGEEHPHAT